MIRENILCNAKTGEIRRQVIQEQASTGVDAVTEIAECKLRLAQTDYAVIKIAEGAATREQYADLIAERAALRARIAVLESYATS